MINGSADPDGEPEAVPAGTLRVAGVPGSPYTRKLISALRYRRIPYRYITRGSKDDKGLQNAKGPPLLPNLIFNDGLAVSDTTPIIENLERTHPERSIYPTNSMRFLNKLLEDYADEWHTKHMFHFRWWFKEDIEKSGRILPVFADHSMPERTYQYAKQFIAERQVARVHAVTGSNQVTAPVIEESYKSLLRVLQAHFQAGNRFLFGSRPASADFALFGQFTCLAQFDPTPMRLAEELAPRVVGYTFMLEDASGFDLSGTEWNTDVGPSLKAILKEAGRLYAPFMVANAQAIAKGEKEVSTVLDGRPYTANAFPYQAKCLKWLRDDYSKLSSADKAFVDSAIQNTGLEVMFAGDHTTQSKSRL